MSFKEELKRRNVLRIGLAYLAVSWLLIQVVETLFPIYELSDAAIKVVVTILAVGFVPVLVFAWAFELTPEGIKKDSEVDRDAPATLGAGKTLDRVIMIVLALALGFFAFDKFVLDPARDAEIIESVTQRVRTEALYESYGDKSIVVLPFVNMSPDPDQEYFADGISEELLNLLSRIQELRVISRTSAFSFKGKDVDIPTIAEKLKVDHVLEGSVRKSGNRIRITTQLIDARTDTHLWSATYDRTLDDVFVVQDEIAAEIVAQLRITLLGKSPETRKIDPEAYVLYLQARHLAWSGDSDDMIQAETLLKQVLALEPDYVPAMNELYVVYYRQGYAFDIRSREEGKRLAEEMNRKALGVDPDDAVATANLAWRHMEDQLDPAGAARLFEEAIASDPTDEDIIRFAGSFARMIGRPDQAIALGEYAIARNPRCAVCFHQLSMAYRDSGRLEEAEANGNIARALGMRLDYSIAKTKLQQGRAEEALLVFEQMDGRNHQKLHAMAMALYSLGRQAEFEATFAELRKRWGDEQPIFIALVYSWAGDTDAAFAWLDRAIEKEAFAVIRVYASPFFRNLHADPRWDAILEKIGRSPEQLAAIEFNVMLPLSSADSN